MTQLDQSILAKAFRSELVPQDPRNDITEAARKMITFAPRQEELERDGIRIRRSQ